MGLRTIAVQVRPSPALRALYTLDGARPSLGEAFREALSGELSRARASLGLVAECLWWLAEQRAFRPTRAATREAAGWRPGKPVRSAAMLDGELSLDVRALESLVESGDESAKVTSVATRSVLDALKDGALVVAEDARSGRAKVAVAALAREVSAHLQRAERAAQRAAERVAKELERAEREARECAERERSERAARKGARAQREKLEREKLEASRAKTTKSAPGRGANKRPKGPPTSFGGLPDDAEPEDRSAKREALGPRGLVLDAEFFVDEAAIPWPCDAMTLDRARKSLLVRFHPDRAGAAGVEMFQRAMRGYGALARALERVGGANTAGAVAGARVAAAHATQSPAASAPSPTKPHARPAVVSTATPVEPARASSAAVETTEPASRPSKPRRARKNETSGEVVGEWPPRPSRVSAK
jgi:hypothetical protein